MSFIVHSFDSLVSDDITVASSTDARRRPFGFLQLTDACEEESHYWGDVEPGSWALDIWIGSPHDRGRGLGTRAMRVAVERIFERHGAEAVLIDPKVTNRHAIAFYRRLGFEPIAERDFEGDECLVMRLRRLDPE